MDAMDSKQLTRSYRSEFLGGVRSVSKPERLDPNDYNLVNVIGTYMHLVPDGARFMKAKDHDSLVIDMDHNRFYWNSRGVTWGTVFDFYMTYFNVDFSSALRMAQSTGKSLSFEMLESSSEKVYEPVELKIAELHHSRLKEHDYTWWMSRGVLPETVDSLRLGTMKDIKGEQWYTIPVPSSDGKSYDNYKLRRAGDGFPRYRHYRPGLRPALYNPFPTQVKMSNQIVIVAGEIKAIVLGQYGIPTVTSSTGVNTWEPEWSELFDNKEAIICFDPKEHKGYEEKPSSAQIVFNHLFSSGVDVRESPLQHDPDDCIVHFGMRPSELASLLGVRRENIWKMTDTQDWL